MVLELDSRGVHGTPKRFESDRRRDRVLGAEGWRTMRVTWRQLEEPGAITADLHPALQMPGHTPRPHGRQPPSTWQVGVVNGPADWALYP